MSDAAGTMVIDASNRCHLNNYGIGKETVDSLFRAIVGWLREENLPWKQTKYINYFKGPMGRCVIELLFFHYDGPPEREVGSGGELNHCKLYLYNDHLTLNFTGEDSEKSCGINFKYTTKWYETDEGLMRFLLEYLNAYLMRVFGVEPRRFDGNDEEIECIKSTVDNIERTLAGDGLMG